ncbi:hypothetical protein PFLUV_G00092040 [Perca fluviatilis]|uniref:Uncharacterized protein n=1 Tax=Perca fluviatilis TaxID=8168 RepID=A0A6A5F274_PERFL|nr:hypothetical protein PFLUV_G00092040 [Perca fluviatilis]
MSGPVSLKPNRRETSLKPNRRETSLKPNRRETPPNILSPESGLGLKQNRRDTPPNLVSLESGLGLKQDRRETRLNILSLKGPKGMESAFSKPIGKCPLKRKRGFFRPRRNKKSWAALKEINKNSIRSKSKHQFSFIDLIDMTCHRRVVELWARMRRDVSRSVLGRQQAQRHRKSDAEGLYQFGDREDAHAARAEHIGG